MALSKAEFERLATAEIDAVFRFVRSLVHSEAEAQDLVQDTYVKAIAAREKFSLLDAGIRPWLLRIARNTWLNRLERSRATPATQPFEDSDELAANELPSPKLDWSLCDERLVAAVSELPETLRSTLLLWAIDGLSYREIATITEVPVGTVMSRLYRARHILAERLEALGKEQRRVVE